MNRKKKLALSLSSAIVYQFVTLACNIILPRFVINAYGSMTNGLINSITQFLGFISFAELGMGAVVQSALYKPIAEKNDRKVSEIYDSSRRFFNRIGFILFVYVLLLVIFYPVLTHSDFDYSYVVWMILVISVSSFAQYYLGINNQILLNADQRTYVSVITQSILLILNTIVCVLLIKLNYNAVVMKAASSLVFLIRPVVLMIVVKKDYHIIRKIEYVGEPIKQKWNGIAQHTATVVLTNTPVAVLTVFSTLQNVSVYSVYYLVAHGVRQIVVSLTSGMQALLGNMYAKNEEKLERAFDLIETAIHFVVVVMFSITGILILQFIKIYTFGIEDVNYIDPSLAIAITVANALFCLRLPYQMMVYAAGHYKQTQKASFIEAGLNILVSIIGVIVFGVAGVSYGMCIAMLYRTINFMIYLSRNILHRSPKEFLKKIFVDLTVIFSIIILLYFVDLDASNYLEWIRKAVIVTLIATTVAIGGFSLAYPSSIKGILIMIKGKARKQS